MMTRSASPLLMLNNGVQIPALGLGVFQSPPEETAGTVESALTQGYRLIHTAAAYFKPARIAENFDVFDFELSKGQLAAIDALDTGVRRGPEHDSITLEAYGREIPEA